MRKICRPFMYDATCMRPMQTRSVRGKYENAPEKEGYDSLKIE